MKRLLLIPLIASIAACAQSPDAIAPIPMGDAYARNSCSNARAQLVTEKANLAALSEQQRSAQAGDAIGVLLIGIPISSVAGGNKAGLIGAAKGKIIGLEARISAC
jgi:hypothetical protein